MKKQMKQTTSHKRSLSTTMMVLAALVLIPGLALAGTGGPWDGAAQSVEKIFTGGLMRTIAVVAVIACGIAAMAGKLSWDWAIKIVIGIVLMFGAPAIVGYFTSAVA